MTTSLLLQRPPSARRSLAKALVDLERRNFLHLDPVELLIGDQLRAFPRHGCNANKRSRFNESRVDDDAATDAYTDAIGRFIAFPHLPCRRDRSFRCRNGPSHVAVHQKDVWRQFWPIQKIANYVLA